MIATALIAGAAFLVGTSLIIKFWNIITANVKEVIAKVREIIHAAVLGVRVFLRKTSDGFMHVTKNYSQNAETKKWKETVVKRTINENDIPKEKRERMTMDAEFDITEEYEGVLLHGAAV